MKKILLGIILISALSLAACTKKTDDSNTKSSTTSSSEILVKKFEEKIKSEDLVKIPDPYFQTKEAVEAKFKAAGLTPQFVKSNFDEKAITNKRFLRTNECDQLDGDQAGITYYDLKEAGDLFGLYAKKGSTIIVGYSDHDFDGTVGESSSTSESDSSNTLAIEENTSSSNETTLDSSVFNSTDVSDEKIKSIKTYDDYIKMYKAIIDNYFANYENIVKDTILYDQASFEQQKTELNNSFEEQKKEYASYGNKKLVGKDDLVEFLISYRDSLKEYTDQLETSLQ